MAAKIAVTLRRVSKVSLHLVRDSKLGMRTQLPYHWQRTRLEVCESLLGQGCYSFSRIYNIMVASCRVCFILIGSVKPLEENDSIQTLHKDRGSARFHMNIDIEECTYLKVIWSVSASWFAPLEEHSMSLGRLRCQTWNNRMISCSVSTIGCC